MKLCLDASVVRPPLAGVQRAVRQQCLALLRQATAADTTVFCRDAIVRAGARVGGAVSGPLPAWSRHVALRVFWQQFILPRQLRRTGAEVLLAMAYTAPQRCPVPYALVLHDIIALERPDLCSYRNVWHMRALLAGSARRAAAVLVSSVAVADRACVCLNLPVERVHHVPLGVDFKRFAEFSPAPAALSCHKARPYLLFVGNLEPKKSIDALITAYAGSADALGVDLVLAGRPAWRSAGLMQRIWAYNGPGAIRCLGGVEDSDLPGLYQHAWAFVFPSLREGFGLPVLEAMAAGVPVVHSNEAAVSETAGGAGIEFPAGNAEALGKALIGLRESATLQEELRGRGRERAQVFSWARWAATTVDILRYSSV